MFKFVLRAAALAAAVLAGPGLASAATFAGSWEVTQIASKDPGLVVSSSSTGGAFSTPDLAVGESHVFKLFRLWTDEASVNDDDIKARPIKVAFSLAGGGAGVLAGTTTGKQGPIFDRPQKGVLGWDKPLELDFGKGGKVSIALMGGDFNAGLFDLLPGKAHGLDVAARLTYVNAPAPAPVPVPAALPLLLGGIGALGFAARRRRGAA